MEYFLTGQAAFEKMTVVIGEYNLIRSWDLLTVSSELIMTASRKFFLLPAKMFPLSIQQATFLC